ncbi:ParB/RepB/Spo0J family partition protein [Candidatus Galacturonibacter soehngenii]|uniref:ParB/RepB/Spo0J family partition protein n=1 Tax=Candidatus Galacturonatibacter soehngenii TaxID=2307010 RepID=A0A7V7QK07_9FIRM|nr:ParB/RepB/Spo0J family partition protein [Candidatus Galacturonibacter soehngenii]
MKKSKELCSLWNNEQELQTGNVRISELHEFKGHPFRVEHDMQLFELSRSIEEKGVLVPLIVRPNTDGEGYEIIAGHRRKAACECAGVDTVPVMVMQLDDAEATIAMIDSNLQREHIRPSEKAFAYKMKLEAMKQQGKRNDLFQDGTLSPVGTKLDNPTLELNQLVCSYDDLGKWELDSQPLEKERVRTDELLARQIGESRNQIARYIRLTNLIPKILDMVDEEKLAFRSAVELSYLSEEEQYELHAVMELEQVIPSLSQANRMKRMSQSGKLDMDMLYEILGEEKPNQREKLKIYADSLEGYNSFYFSEEILSTLDRNKNIKVRDRATLFNLVIGLNGYTVSTGVISKELNGENIIAKPLKVEEYMCVGTIKQKNMTLSRYGKVYMESLKIHISEYAK